ncbi:glycine hydroxymethyltransferase [Thermosporothrix hazakensis]|jgi:glycine hydroxymethyltransferase|uniref:Glycine hydroxymethyltransferase n=2 Tax=Thermosporothrix TaxID=768650 RepID=A0A326UBX5_THEHA|nr:serine hydroxymethyltransferase [Thermosporothrix hazakensis]PZW36122.1 glycine hydroxymethyltransferase [Thermosporothrix hazakensis]BBH88588.1 serine hydroxymethyltransferase [Thermosporothrix sp. COM3]GCE46773.1 serine hydroxymethyltransferase [Thermosporothrix hazakensis]
MTVDIHDLEAILARQEEWRQKQTINLIASENAQSPAVRRVQNSDFMGRYAEGHPNEPGKVLRYYQGTKYIDEIESMVTREICELFGAKQADVRPISGNAANTAIALGYLRGGDAVVANSTDAGGHISHGPVGVIGRRIQNRGQLLKLGSEKSVHLHYLPLTEDRYHVDAQKAIELIDTVSPQLVIMGKSLFLFPEPLSEVAAFCQTKKIPVLYDAAHVLGLIAGGQFQDPLREGATWMTGSTHKTFPGPQRGVILSNLESPEAEKKYWAVADRGVFPGSSSNHHLHSLAGLVVATREMKQYGREYAQQIIRNAQALGRALDELGTPVEAREFGYTQSHIIAVNVAEWGGGVEVAKRLEENDIILNYNMLPGDSDPRNPSGLRIGTSEMTRFGMDEKAMGELAQLMHDAIRGKDVKEEVHRLRSRFLDMKYV